MEPELQSIIAAITAMAALGTAAFGVVDATKAFGGGISNVGFGHIRRGVEPFANVLHKAVGASFGPDDWAGVLRAQWINGRSKEDQVAVVRNLVRLGLTEGAIEELAGIANVDAAMLKQVATQLAAGVELTEPEIAVLGRVDAVIGVRIDAAFEKADQQYRNVARVAAAVVAIVFAVVGGYAIETNTPTGGTDWIWQSLLVGVLAVPIAPLAKDLISALSASVRAVKSARAL